MSSYGTDGQYPPRDPSRQFMSYPPAVDFIENRGHQYHPAINTSGSQYDNSLMQYVPLSLRPSIQASSSFMVSDVAVPSPRAKPSSINDMGFWAEVFPKAMKRLNDEPEPRGGYLPEWGIRRSSAWRDVQAKLDIARQRYEFYYNQKYVGKLRRGVRSTVDKLSMPIKQATKAVPNVDIVSPVLGAVNILLDAYRQAAEVREEVNSGFDDLPASFTKMDLYFRIYPEDGNIKTASIELVFTTFKAIESAITFYTSNQAKRVGLAVFTGPEYQEKLLKRLKGVKSCCDALVGEADLSSKHRIVSDNTATHRGIGTVIQEEQWTHRLLNYLLVLLVERDKNWPVSRSPIPSRSSTPQPGSQLHWLPRELWTDLRIPNLDEEDMRYVLGSAAQIFPEDRGRAEQVIETHHFRNWIINPGSAKLLVHGDFDAEQNISPFSVLCATVLQAFRMQRGATISLVFFCGRHLAEDEYQGGAAMIRSLLAQLLRQFPFPSIQPDPKIPPPAIEDGNIDQLCRLFVDLIRQLPWSTTVFCLIDSINLYEAEEYLHSMDGVVLCLLGLANPRYEGSRAKFKLLLLSPRPTVEVRQAFDDDPETLLHMAQLPINEQEMGVARIQEQLGAGVGGLE